MSDLREVRHPEVRVRLVGEDGNAFGVLGSVRSALRHAARPPPIVSGRWPP